MTDANRTAFEAWATDYFGANVSYPEACFDAWQAAMSESICPECHCHFTATEVTAPGSTRLVNTAQPAEPLVFGMRGPKMTFTIGNQSFTLDYEPETADEYEFMGNMLKAAISKLPLGVKIGAQPADPFKKLSDAQVLWLAESHGIDVYASNPLAFYADLISTTPAQPDHSYEFPSAPKHHDLIAELRKPMHYLSMAKRNRAADALEGKQ